MHCAAGALNQSLFQGLAFCASREPADLCPPCQGPTMTLPKLSPTRLVQPCTIRTPAETRAREPRQKRTCAGDGAARQSRLKRSQAKQAPGPSHGSKTLTIHVHSERLQHTLCSMLQGVRSPGTAPCSSPGGAVALRRQNLPTHSGCKRWAVPRGTVPWAVRHGPSPAP